MKVAIGSEWFDDVTQGVRDMAPIRIAVALLLGAVVTTAMSGCPSAPCPTCTIKTARFTVPPTPSGDRITTVVMHAEATFTGHCAGGEPRSGCTKSEDKNLGRLSEGEHREEMPWESDDDDRLTAEVEIDYERAESVTVTATIEDD